jgi:hypothetical protein
MSVFVEGCKEHVRLKNKVADNDTSKKSHNSFSLEAAIKKEKIAYEKEVKNEEGKKKEDKLLIFLQSE